MFLVNDNGVIKTIDSKVIRRADDGTGPTVELCSALREAREHNEELQVEVKDKSREIERLSQELKDNVTGKRTMIAEKDHELAVLKEALVREKQKSKALLARKM